jgi:hypothetical protein
VIFEPTWTFLKSLAFAGGLRPNLGLDVARWAARAHIACDAPVHESAIFSLQIGRVRSSEVVAVPFLQQGLELAAPGAHVAGGSAARCVAGCVLWSCSRIYVEILRAGGGINRPRYHWRLTRLALTRP